MATYRLYGGLRGKLQKMLGRRPLMEVKIEIPDSGPRECQVWHRGQLIFDGQSRDARMPDSIFVRGGSDGLGG